MRLFTYDAVTVRCDCCVFFGEREDRPGADAIGSCHRFPPQPIGDDEETQPIVYASGWCGEFLPSDGGSSPRS